MDSTPMMRQYSGFKKQYPDKILLYRMGDFFETFGDDAKITSKVLNITLTKRNKEKDAIALAGFPHKAIEQYLPKLIESGYSVVIVDQLEDPKLAKGIVKRGVTRIVTPGTVDGEQASAIKDSYLTAFFFEGKNRYCSLVDLSTGKFLTLSPSPSKGYVNNILSAYEPVEILLLEGDQSEELGNSLVHFVEKGLRNLKYSQEVVQDFYNVKSINSLGIEDDSAEVVPVAMLIKYIEETQLMNPQHILKPQKISLNSTMVLDRATIRNLEIINNSYTGGIENSLFFVLNKTCTRMGTRLLYSWLLNPLIVKKEIDHRLNVTDKFFQNENVLRDVREKLEGINDIERVVGKIGLNRVTPRDIKGLQGSLINSDEILEILKKDLNIKYEKLDRKFFTKLAEKIEETIADDPPITIMEGGIIKTGFNKDVDELRTLSGDSKDWLKELEEKERKETGIPSLKIGFNNVFGYYIDVTKAHQEKVPDRYIRKQTLVNSERYITEELKEKEEIILVHLSINCLMNLENHFYLILENFKSYLR